MGEIIYDFPLIDKEMIQQKTRCAVYRTCAGQHKSCQSTAFKTCGRKHDSITHEVTSFIRLHQDVFLQGVECEVTQFPGKKLNSKLDDQSVPRSLLRVNRLDLLLDTMLLVHCSRGPWSNPLQCLSNIYTII